MVKGVKDFILNGRTRFVFLFSLVSLFVLKSVNAVVYLGQTYTGWSAFGYGFNDLQSFYYAYPGWIDFVVLFALFYSAALGVFGKKFEENNAGKGLAVAIGLVLSLSVALFEAAQGIYMWQWGAPLVVVGLLVAVFFGVYHLSRKMRLAGLTAFLLAAVITYLVWLAITTWTGMGQMTFISFTMGNIDLGNWLFWVLVVIGLIALFALLKSLFSGDDFGGRGRRGPRGPRGGPGQPGRTGRSGRRGGRGDPGDKGPHGPTGAEGIVGPPGDPGGRGPSPVPGVPGGGTTPGEPGQLALPPGPVMKVLGPGEPWKTQKVDPVRIRRLGQIYNKIRSLIGRNSKLTLQLISVLHELKKGVTDEPSLATSEGKVQRRIDKLIKELTLFNRTLLSKTIDLDGIENMRAYFKGILLEMNKIMRELSAVSSLKDYIRRANRIALTIWETDIKQLSKAVRVLKSGSREYLGNNVGKLTMLQFVQVLVVWKKNSGRIVRGVTDGPGDEGEVQGHDVVAFSKDIYRKIALGCHTDKTRGYDEGTRARLRAIFERAVQAYKEGDHQELVRLRDEMISIIGDTKSGEGPKALKSGTSIEALEDILSVPIAIPRSRRGIFVTKKKIRELNVPQFASYVLFSSTSNRLSDAYKLREQVTSVIPNAFTQLTEMRRLLDRANYYVKNSRNYRAFVEQYEELMALKPKIDQLANGMKANRLNSAAKRAYTNLIESTEFNRAFLKKFGQRATTGGWEVVFSDPKKVAFILEYPRKDGGQKLLWRYFNLSYDALISLDAMLNKLKDGPVRQIKKDWSNP